MGKLQLCLLPLISALMLTSCSETPAEPSSSDRSEMALPVGHSNNAVAKAEGPNGTLLFSFNGLRSGKTFRDASKQAFVCDVMAEQCKAMDDLPVAQGRLASAAVTVANIVYVFGGYTIAEDGTEVSTPETFALDPITLEYTRKADMPVPVDDMVVLSYQDRYIYLVSGWHDEANVKFVQVYDTQLNRWFRATDYPGRPVFGHAGGIVDGAIIIADGVAVVEVVNNKRRFGAINEVWRGDIDPADPSIITWSPQKPHDGKPLYRMASAGDKPKGRVVFAGGSDNPYNYNGIGYDGKPSRASSEIFSFDIKENVWLDIGEMEKPSMDHRGLIVMGDNAYILGGMDDDRNVLDTVTKISLRDEGQSPLAQ